MKYLEQIPISWLQVNLSDYIKIINLIPDTDLQSTTAGIEIVEAAFYVFTGQLMNKSGIKPDEVTAIYNRLDFMFTLPTVNDSTIKFTPMNELNYDKFIHYQKLIQEPDEWLDNLPAIVKIFAPDGVEVEDINVADAMGCFFLQQKLMKKRLLSLAICLIWKTIKNLVKTLLQKKQPLLTVK